jgi:hypothetical protein
MAGLYFFGFEDVQNGGMEVDYGSVFPPLKIAKQGQEEANLGSCLHSPTLKISEFFGNDSMVPSQPAPAVLRYRGGIKIE